MWLTSILQKVELGLEATRVEVENRLQIQMSQNMSNRVPFHAPFAGKCSICARPTIFTDITAIDNPSKLL